MKQQAIKFILCLFLLSGCTSSATNTKQDPAQEPVVTSTTTTTTTTTTTKALEVTTSVSTEAVVTTTITTTEDAKVTTTTPITTTTQVTTTKPVVTTTTTTTTAAPLPSFKDLKVGDTIILGKYEQDNNLKNGKEPIEWDVLDVQNGKALLVSKYVLLYGGMIIEHDFNRGQALYQGKDPSGEPDWYYEINWEDSDLRKQLNNDFYNNSFTKDEQALIILSKISNTTLNKVCNYDVDKQKAQLLTTSKDADTLDKVFVLSLDEVIKYYGNVYPQVTITCDSLENENPTYLEFKENPKVLAKGTKYFDQVFYLDMGYQITFRTYRFYTLRTPALTGNHFFCIDVDSSLVLARNFNYSGVRPAMWIDINN